MMGVIWESMIGVIDYGIHPGVIDSQSKLHTDPHIDLPAHMLMIFSPLSRQA